MTTTQTKLILFKIENNPKINQIIGLNKTLYVKATIVLEQEALSSEFYYGYYDMYLSSYSKQNIISDALRSKILFLLNENYFSEKKAFSLDENVIYDFSDMKRFSIEGIK